MFSSVGQPETYSDISRNGSAIDKDRDNVSVKIRNDGTS